MRREITSIGRWAAVCLFEIYSEIIGLKRITNPLPAVTRTWFAISTTSVMDDSPSTKERRDSLMEAVDEPKRLQLLDLPPEILLLLSEFLNSPSKASTRLTCRILSRCIPIPERPGKGDVCARTALHRHSNEHRNAARDKHQCALCKALYPDALFHHARVLDPDFDFSNFAGLDPLCLAKEEQGNWLPSDKLKIPSTRICSWHTNRFIFPPTAGFHQDPEFERLIRAAATSTSGSCPHSMQSEVAKHGWTSSIEPVCMHCGRIVVCVCSVGSCNMCPCDCDSCGVRLVRCWWKLARSGHGSPAVREANFQLAKRRWLVTRAEMDKNETGTDFGGSHNLEWGAGRTVKCARDPTVVIAHEEGPA